MTQVFDADYEKLISKHGSTTVKDENAKRLNNWVYEKKFINEFEKTYKDL